MTFLLRFFDGGLVVAYSDMWRMVLGFLALVGEIWVSDFLLVLYAPFDSILEALGIACVTICIGDQRVEP